MSIFTDVGKTRNSYLRKGIGNSYLIIKSNLVRGWRQNMHRNGSRNIQANIIHTEISTRSSTSADSILL